MILEVSVTNGDISLSANGTVTAAGMTSTFIFSTAFHLVPTFTMAPSLLIEALAGLPPTLSVPGLLGSTIDVVGTLLSSHLTEAAINPVASLVNDLVSRQVIEKLGLDVLPSGSILSIRELTATADGIKIVPALGAFGTVLSDFQPSQPQTSAQLIALDVQPTTVVTDGQNSVAQGKITLDRAAPSGGVSVQLTCDRADLVRIEPATLTVPEGAISAAFTATAIAQSLMASTTLDRAISASLHGQFLSTSISVTAAAPVANAAQSPSIFPLSPTLLSNAIKRVGAISSGPPDAVGILNLMMIGTYQRPGSMITAAVELTEPFATETVSITFDPNVMTPLFVKVEDLTNFQFYLPENFSSNTLRITATVLASGKSKSIEVPITL